MMSALLLAVQVATPSSSSAATPAQATDEATIVVVGRAPADTAGALERCLAQGCPAKEDIALSLAHAQAQFVAGDYAGSRRTLTKARGRNRGYADRLPVEVSDLHRANSRMAGLVGLVDESRKGVFDIVDALKKGLDKKDERVMLARLELGAAFAKDGRSRFAFDEYRAVERFARKSGNRPLQGLAIFQRAALLGAMAAEDAEMRPAARRVAALLTGSTEPSWRVLGDAARMIPVMLEPPAKREEMIDEVAKTMAPRPVDRMLLLYAPPIRLGGTASLAGERTEWMDFRYTIGRDGRVRDVALLRGSDKARPVWVEAVASALGRRRYAPIALSAGEAEPQRTERVSFVSDFTIDWGSKSSSRNRDRRAVAQDLNGKALGER